MFAVNVGDATGLLAWLALGACALAVLPAGLRWLRVAQREHYIAGSASRFAMRWWGSEPVNVVSAVVALASIVVSGRWPVFAFATATLVALGPRHLSLRGRTSPLASTRRLRSLAVLWVVLQVAVIGIGVAAGVPAPFAAAGAALVPVLIDLACAVMAPIERRLGRRYVRKATERLGRVAPVIVGITGSYGKTSTKGHIAHLISGTKRVVVSPASFNNEAGLARTINEHLADGTEVFVAEMGTYGPGEIAALCRWCPPQMAVITAIGPVHLERFGSVERIAAAKAEITTRASLVVLNVDDPELVRLAEEIERTPGHQTVLRCSGRDPGADVCVQRSGELVSVWVSGRKIVEGAAVSPGVQATNLALAVAVALQLGVDPEALAGRVASLPAVANRLNMSTAPSGLVILDDTYNANPAGAIAALGLLAAVEVDRRRAVVTPGMVELGPRQRAENRAFAEAAAEVATDFVVVGRTNRRALTQGAVKRVPVTVRTREDAVKWVRTHLGIGDAVLYENDLPDHYP